ncbi:hypothetical protein llap_10545 [Limosa lapponica baueri]|uniref:Uncharacterized protein n=1 Tax=Limosa lapponica baueri TaxID=1758121 RepID=A0A2I0TZE6_LIMLA|nr:hypothetical protein llap_10545 [Limosa lapponica baueri]
MLRACPLPVCPEELWIYRILDNGPGQQQDRVLIPRASIRKVKAKPPALQLSPCPKKPWTKLEERVG